MKPCQGYTVPGIILLILSMMCYTATAQTYEEYVRQQKKAMEDLKKQQKDAIDKQKADFKKFVQARDDYMRKMDSAYAVYLKQRWQSFQVFAGLQPPERPKPVKQPELQHNMVSSGSNPMNTGKTKIALIEAQGMDLPVLQKSTPEQYATRQCHFNFYGKDIQYHYDENFVSSFPQALDERVIARNWNNMNDGHYIGLIRQMLDTKNELNLNDWGYYLLVKNTCMHIAPQSINAQRFLQWFLLLKSNYKVKLAYKQGTLYLLIPAVHDLYNMPFLSFNQQKYYSLHGQQADLHTYEHDFPEARKIMDFNLYRPVNLPDKPVRKVYQFNYQGEKQHIAIRLNQHLIDFYGDYPQADIRVYFDGAVSLHTKESIVESLSPMLADKDDITSVAYLLQFVQKAFGYQTDQEQFGREKFFFADEVLFYPYSDCEDRSVFFAYLVRELLGLEVLGLAYSDHMATAVRFAAPVNGDYITWKNKRYVVCDPTYINAPVGKTQPGYTEQRAEVIELLNNQYQSEQATAIWEQVMKAGGYHGNTRGDIVFDDHGNAYLTGYYMDNMRIGEYNSTSTAGSHDLFIAKYTANGQPEWIKFYGGRGTDIGQTLRLDPVDQNLYVSGSFTEEIRLGDQTFQAGEKGDVFLMKLNTRGDLLWANQAGLESPDNRNDLIYTSTFSSDGELQWTRLYEQMESYQHFGIDLDEQGNPIVKGAIYATPGFITSTRTFADYAEFDYVKNLKTENDKLLQDAYNPSIAGLFAVIRLIQASGFSLPGTLAQEALDEYNPEFRKNSPSIYENIGKVRFIRNSKGIVVVRTDNGRQVNFSYLRVNDNSQLKIFRYNSGNAQINVLSGMKVGKAFIWYDLNHIKLFSKTGDLLFDYDEDHTQKKVNLKEDILY